jgi:sugar/nucleoside kinase (ribokinase family)
MNKKTICIGNALVDKICMLENDTMLSQENLPKGSMQIINQENSIRLQNTTSHLKSEISTGGSAANTANGLANLGIETAYVGMVGKDNFGDFYIEDMQKNNIKTKFFKSENTQTGLALALVSQDGERTFATHLGAAIELNASLITKELFDGYEYLHIEGYLISNRDLFKKIIECGKQSGCKISIDLASYNVVEENLEFLQEVCKGVEVIFANEQEAEAFTKTSAEEAVHIIAEYANIAVVKLGAKGSIIKHNGQITTIEEVKRNKIDTTGAGDLYASGFLAGLCQNLPLNQCGKMGSVLAGNVIEIMGTKMSPERWSKIKEEISNSKI